MEYALKYALEYISGEACLKYELEGVMQGHKAQKVLSFIHANGEWAQGHVDFIFKTMIERARVDVLYFLLDSGYIVLSPEQAKKWSAAGAGRNMGFMDGEKMDKSGMTACALGYLSFRGDRLAAKLLSDTADKFPSIIGDSHMLWIAAMDEKIDMVKLALSDSRTTERDIEIAIQKLCYAIPPTHCRGCPSRVKNSMSHDEDCGCHVIAKMDVAKLLLSDGRCARYELDSYVVSKAIKLGLYSVISILVADKRAIKTPNFDAEILRDLTPEVTEEMLKLAKTLIGTKETPK